MHRFFEPHNKSKPLEDKINTDVSGNTGKLWYMNGKAIGSYVATTTLNKIKHLGKLESAVMNPNDLRQLAVGHTEGAHDLGGFYLLSDIGGVWLFEEPKKARKWAKQIDPTLAPSLMWIDSGKGNVSFNVVSAVSSSI